MTDGGNFILMQRNSSLSANYKLTNNKKDSVNEIVTQLPFVPEVSTCNIPFKILVETQKDKKVSFD